MISPGRVPMFDSPVNVSELTAELCELGWLVHQQNSCPHCSAQFGVFWQRQDTLAARVENYAFLQEENVYLRDRISRHIDFGESLEDLI